MLRVVIIDDEPAARQRIRGMLSKESGVEVVGEASSAREALPLLIREKPNAVFLDVLLGDADGFDLLRKLEVVPAVVFVTGYSEHAVEAFDFEAVDYILKPVREERLHQAVERLRLLEPDASNSSWFSQDRICFRMPKKTVVARLDAILALRAEGDFTRVYLEANQPLFICRRLQHYEEILPAPPFLRIDRSLIIHTGMIERVEPEEGSHHQLYLRGVSSPFRMGPAAWKRVLALLPPT